jgi:hypothetical protein
MMAGDTRAMEAFFTFIDGLQAKKLGMMKPTGSVLIARSSTGKA